MPIKIENRSSSQTTDFEQYINAAAECVPTEHLRGLARIVIVDRIDDPRLPKDQAASLPALYFPKVPGSPTAYGEIALAVLLPDTSFFKRFVAKSQLKANVVQCTLLIIGQHHFITMSGRRKGATGAERVVRDYVERYFKIWRDRQQGLRARLAKPLLPYLERWQKAAQKRYAEEARRKRAS